MAEETSITQNESILELCDHPKDDKESQDLASTANINGKYNNYGHSRKQYKTRELATNSHPLIVDKPKIKYKLSEDSSSEHLNLSDSEPVNGPQNDLSDNETEKSIYEAHLSSNYQNVALTMNEKEGNLNFLPHGKKSNKLRKIKVISIDVQIDSDLSSLESSPDSLKSDEVFSENHEAEAVNGNDSHDEIEPISEVEERRQSMCWQKIVLPDGEKRSIDMRVIEPYKRVLSHGGYLRTGCQTSIILFSACFLPDKSRCDYDYVMDNLFLYVLWTLDRLVTEDYVLVYMNGGATRLPSFHWVKRCYQLVGRKLRKNLCQMYFVHPTLWIKTMLYMAKPFISSKFFKKISFINTLKELRGKIPVELAAIPDKVKAHDASQCGT